MLLDKKTLFFGACFIGGVTLFFSYHLWILLRAWNPSVGVLIITLLGIVFILPFIVFHWLYWDFIIWDWKRDAPSFYYHINHDFSWLKYLGFGPVLATAIAPFLRASRPTIRHNVEFTLLMLLLPILAYCTLAYLRGLLNVHKR